METTITLKTLIDRLKKYKNIRNFCTLQQVKNLFNNILKSEYKQNLLDLLIENKYLQKLFIKCYATEEQKSKLKRERDLIRVKKLDDDLSHFNIYSEDYIMNDESLSSGYSYINEWELRHKIYSSDNLITLKQFC